LLFIGRDFALKGGYTAISIINNLVKKYDWVRGVIVSDVPKKILDEYAGNKKIKFYSLMSHEKLFSKIYPNSDVLLYPTFSDTFGFAILEAQSFGLPVIAMKTASTHTIQETISEGETGFVINNLDSDASNRIVSKKVIAKMTEKVEKLITNDTLLNSMSKKCRKVIKDGKFSIERRNKKLKKIYEDAIK